MPWPHSAPRLVSALLLAWASVLAPAYADDAPPGTETPPVTATDPAAIPIAGTPTAPAATDAAAPAEEAPAQPPLVIPDTCTGYHVDDPRWFDRAQGYFSQRACTPAVWFDRFFGNDREEDVATALVRIIPSIQYSDRDFTDAGVHFKARVKLPNLKNRFDVIINDDTDDRIGLLPGEVARPQQGNASGRESSAAMRYLLVKADQSGTDVDIGLRSQAKFFARLRYFHKWTYSQVLQTRFTQSVFFRDGEGYGETSLYEVERMLADDLLLRWSNQLTATEDLGGMQWRDGLMLLRQFDRDRALSLTVAMTADSEPAWKDSGYFTSLRYRQRAFRPWFFFEIEPFVDAIRSDRFNTNPGIAFRVEVWLGDSGGKSGITMPPPPTADVPSAPEQPKEDEEPAPLPPEVPAPEVPAPEVPAPEVPAAAPVVPGVTSPTSADPTTGAP